MAACAASTCSQVCAASGTGGVDVRPVAMFVRAGCYTLRLSMQRVADQVGVQAYMDTSVCAFAISRRQEYEPLPPPYW